MNIKNKKNKMSDLKEQDFFAKDEVAFIKARAEQGIPTFEFDYGNYFLLAKKDEKKAEVWWNKFYQHANGEELFEASSMFAYLGDQYYDWCMKCLKKSASLDFELSKKILAKMEEHPFKFPEA